MDFEFVNELKIDYVHVYCRGMLNAELMLGMWERAFNIAASEGRKGVLVDIRELTGEPYTTIQRFEVARRVAALQRDCGRIIAIALVGEEPMIDPQRFGETVAKNRGVKGCVFTDIDMAVAWLENHARTR